MTRKEIKELEKMLSSGDDSPEIYLRLSVLYDQEGKPHRSYAILKRLLAKHPDNAHAYHNLGRLSERDGKLEEALTHYTRACELDGKQKIFRKDLKRVQSILKRRDRIQKVKSYTELATKNFGFMVIFIITPVLILSTSFLAVDVFNGNSYPGLMLILKRLATFSLSLLLFFAMLKLYK